MADSPSTPLEPGLYYIQDTRRAMGNCAVWWCPNSSGYTCDLNEAGLYSSAQIEKLDKLPSGVPRLVADVDSLVVEHVDMQRLRRLQGDDKTGGGS